jgi:glycosyltransferase involved in cell wall biosynthesis
MVYPSADNLAGALVLVLREGLSLESWESNGELARDWSVYAGLMPRYGRIVLVSSGQSEAQERAALSRVVDVAQLRQLQIVADASPDGPERDARLGARLAELLRGVPTIVVKGALYDGGHASVAIASALRAGGASVGHVVTGGFLWSRFVSHEHGPHSVEHNQVAEIEGALCCAADVVIGTTQDMVDDLTWRYQLAPGKGQVVPHFVVSEGDVTPSAEREPGTLMYAGPLVKRKRLSLLIEAAALLSEEHRERVSIELAGVGPEQEALEMLAQERGVPCRFVGRLPQGELLGRLSKATIYCQCSELEGHPRAVIDAMAAGIPVVVADTPGLSDLVTHGTSGLRVSATPQAIAHAIGGLLDDPDWRESIGATASRIIRSIYAIPVIVEREAEAHRLALSLGSRRSVEKAA